MEPLDPEVGGVNGHGPPEIDQKMFDTITGAKIENSTHARSIIELVMRLCNIGDPDDPVADYTSLYKPEVLVELRKIREDFPEQYKGYFEPWARQRSREMFWPELDRMIAEALLPSQIPITLPHIPSRLVPPLPAAVMLNPALAAGAGEWLDEYCEYSRHWSNRAPEGFHAGVGLWALSTLVARRICVETGRRQYPILFFAMVARSTLYAKTTTADLGLSALEEYLGCPYLLAPDKSTPQALIREMAGRVPQDYGVMPVDQQDLTRRRIAFAGQRGWFYEEWGGMLKQMLRADSTMSGFHELLRQLDDGRQTFTSNTISRGMEYVKGPYLALLANATPHDLQRFMQPGSDFWHDGFWPRFVFLFPRLHEAPTLDMHPWGKAILPPKLVRQAMDWHNWLGLPEVDIEPVLDKKGNPTGELKSKQVKDLPCHVLTVDPAVQDAYQAYNVALMEMVIRGDVAADLESWYGRLHAKALRVAMLLCSLKETTMTFATPTITMPYWIYAQNLTESWRVMMHEGLEIIARSQPLSKEEQLEIQIEALVRKDGPRTSRECQQYLHASSEAIRKSLTAMTHVGRLVSFPTTRTTRYGLPTDAPETDDDDMGTTSAPADDEGVPEGEQSDVPF